MSSFIIGLTGGIGSGKTTITNYFSELGVEIIDADIIAREVVAKGSSALIQIKQHFGEDYIQEDGSLNRALLREKVFSEPQAKLWLNNLLHPLIRQQIILQTTQAKTPYCILVAPLLIENNLKTMVDRVLVIDVSESTQLTRTMQRDNNSAELAKSIIASQISRKERLIAADDVINNDDVNLFTLKDNVISLDKKYSTLTKVL